MYERSCSFSLNTGKGILSNLIESSLRSVVDPTLSKVTYEISLWQTHSPLKVLQKRCQIQENDVLGDACTGGSCGF